MESGVGKTLKYLLDYCKLYETDVEELKQLIINIDQILKKWKNFVNNILFDDMKNWQDDFSKSKFLKKV